MLNLLPHIYQKIGKWIVLIFLVGQFILAILFGLAHPTQWGDEPTEISNPHIRALEENITNLLYGDNTAYIINFIIVVGIVLYFLSKDKIQDEYVDMLKLKSVSIVFILSAIMGFLLHNISTPLINISLLQVAGYVIILKYFKKFSV